jgi:hypothetical protein
MMLDHVLAYLRNYCEVGYIYGTFEIKDGTLSLPEVLNGQYFKIVGSVFNDGVHQNPAGNLTDEAFTGVVWTLAIPKAVLDIVTEVEAWQEKNGTAASGLYQSESFGGYSYSLKSGNGSSDGYSWQNAFASRLNRWRKI